MMGDASAHLGVPLSPDQVGQLQAYVDMLQRWNRVYNLSAVRDRREMITHHVLDCLAAVGPLRRHASGQPLRVLDVGSGGGLPGVVLAIVEPRWQVSCVDAVGKKASFVRQVGLDLGLPNLQAIHARVQDLPADKRFDVVVSRAFSSLHDFTDWSRDRLDEGGVWVAMKGRVPHEEMAGLSAGAHVFHVEPLTVPGLDAERCLVWLRPETR
jgi:16S rRNA (guanine527-N7)-methyltransferase